MRAVKWMMGREKTIHIRIDKVGKNGCIKRLNREVKRRLK